MANKSALLPPERARVDGLARPLISRFSGTQTEVGVKDATAEALVATLQRAAEAGDVEAECTLHALAIDGAAERIAVLLKQERCLIARNGHVLSMPARWGIRRRDSQGKRQRHHQQALWWELTWAEFQEMVASLRRQAARLGEEAAAWDAVLNLHDRYPDTLTPGEACECAGIDPHEFKLAEAQ